MTDADPPCLSGAVFLRNEKAFRDEVGHEPVDRAYAALTPAQRRELDSVVPAAWVPVEVVDAFYAQIARQAEEDLEPFYARVVERGISQTLRSVWKALLRLNSDRALLSRTPIIYSRGHSVGQIAPTIDAPGHATVLLTGWPGMPHLRQLGVAVGIRAVMGVAGRRNVEVNYDQTDDGATYHVRWDP